MSTTIHSAVCNSTRSIKIGTTLPDQDRVVVQGDFSGNPVEVTRTEFLAAVSRELDVIVIPRADLPEVTVKEDPHAPDNPDYEVEGWAFTYRFDHRAEALRRLAVAEYLDAHPPVDQAQVDALAELLAKEIGYRPTSDGIARRLVEQGVTAPVKEVDPR